jgi:hypothetical protein
MDVNRHPISSRAAMQADLLPWPYPLNILEDRQHLAGSSAQDDGGPLFFEMIPLSRKYGIIGSSSNA